MASLTPSQAAPKWTHTAQEILHLARAAITKHKQAEDEVAALSPDNCTLENVSGLKHTLSLSKLTFVLRRSL